MDQEKVHVGGLHGQGNFVLAKYDQQRCDWSKSKEKKEMIMFLYLLGKQCFYIFPFF